VERGSFSGHGHWVQRGEIWGGNWIVQLRGKDLNKSFRNELRSSEPCEPCKSLMVWVCFSPRVSLGRVETRERDCWE
jgi:hypothetical protein